MKNCPSNKVAYFSPTAAEEALIQDRTTNSYPEGKGPVNVYRCNLCELYHLTSKGSAHPLLKSDKLEKKLKRSLEATKWFNSHKHFPE